MSWRIITLTNPGRVCVKRRQLNWTDETGNIQNIPIEDISVLIIENQFIQISAAVLSELVEAGAAVFTCDSAHLPNGALFPFHNNSRYTETAFAQIESSLPFRKRMWQEIVVQKVKNQSAILRLTGAGSYKNLDILADSVQSGDCQNIEGVAARVYWGALWENFNRNDISNVKNHALDYTYAVLRGCVAKVALIASIMLRFSSPGAAEEHLLLRRDGAKARPASRRHSLGWGMHSGSPAYLSGRRLPTVGAEWGYGQPRLAR